MLKFGMKILRNKRTNIALAFLIVAAGFLFGVWPLSLLGIVFVAVLGHSVSTILLGLLLDVVYGVPTGFLHMMYFPFSIFAAISVLAHALIRGRIRTTQTDTL